MEQRSRAIIFVKDFSETVSIFLVSNSASKNNVFNRNLISPEIIFCNAYVETFSASRYTPFVMR